MTLIKICGLTRPTDIEAVNSALPDFAGFVFAPSRRRISIEQARELSRHLDPRVTPVGVFVDAALVEVVRAVASGAIATVQLHGHEDAVYIAQLKQRLPKTPIIKAYQPVAGADYLLLDNPTPGSGAPLAIATGQLQSLIAASPLPVILAGGINLATIDDALALSPYAVDISTGAESEGQKDREKIAALVHKVRSFHHPRKESIHDQ